MSLYAVLSLHVAWTMNSVLIKGHLRILGAPLSSVKIIGDPTVCIICLGVSIGFVWGGGMASKITRTKSTVM